MPKTRLLKAIIKNQNALWVLFLLLLQKYLPLKGMLWRWEATTNNTKVGTQHSQASSVLCKKKIICSVGSPKSKWRNAENSKYKSITFALYFTKRFFRLCYLLELVVAKSLQRTEKSLPVVDIITAIAMVVSNSGQ